MLNWDQVAPILTRDVLELQMAVSRGAVYINQVSDGVLSSSAAGTAIILNLTRRKYYPLTLDVSELLIGVRVASISADAQVKLYWQYSLDASVWTQSSAVLSPDDTGDSTAIFSTAASLTPFGRLVASVETTNTAVQKVATISAWVLYKYR